MAMKACRECGTEISSRAKVCPNCGTKRPHDLAIQHGLNSFASFCFKLGLIITVLGVAALFLVG